VAGPMTFTLVAKCGAGHSQEWPVDLPGREWAEELARLLLQSKCGVCKSQITVTIAEPAVFN
jgi:hypothetical protein